MSFSLNKISIILTFSLIAGQILKLPVIDFRGPAILDITLIFLSLLGIIKALPKGVDFKNLPLDFYFFVIFIFICILSLTFSPLGLSLDQKLVSSLYIFRLFIFALIFYLVLKKVLVFDTEKIFIFSGIVLSLFGIFQFIFVPDLRFLSVFGWDPHYFRAVSTFLDPNFLGSFLILSLLLISHNTNRYKKFNILIFIIVYLCILLTFSRGSYLSFLVSFTAFSFLKKSIKLLIITMILFIILLLSFNIYQKIVTQPLGIDREQSAMFRLVTWEQGIFIFQKSPLLGVGFNSYRYALKEYGLADNFYLLSRGSSTNDSSLLYVAATTGLAGFLSFLFFLLSLVWNNYKNVILIASLCGLLSQSFFVNNLFYPFTMLFILLMASKYPFSKVQKKLTSSF